MPTDDYTVLPIGTKIDRGEIKVCPHCGQNALFQEMNGKEFYTHGQLAVLGKDGAVSIGIDECPKEKKLETDS